MNTHGVSRFGVDPRYLPPHPRGDHLTLLAQVGDFDVYRSRESGFLAKHGAMEGEFIASSTGRTLDLVIPSAAATVLFVVTGRYELEGD